MRTGYGQKCTRLPVGRNRLPIEKEATELPSQGCSMRLFQDVQMRYMAVLRGCLSCLWVRGTAFFACKKTNAKLVFVLHKSVFLF